MLTINLKRGFERSCTDMPNLLLRAAADRHRLVASTLSNPKDRAIINYYADEVESLELVEVTASGRPANDNTLSKCWMLADSLAKVYPSEPTSMFDDLLLSLDSKPAV